MAVDSSTVPMKARARGVRGGVSLASQAATLWVVWACGALSVLFRAGASLRIDMVWFFFLALLLL